jgi:hypothetical protein
MRGGLACTVVACALLAMAAASARADAIDKQAKDLRGESPYKVRLAATLALAKSRDARAVIALSGVLSHDEDATLRKLSALALEKMVDAKTDVDARELALGALESAQSDADTSVRDAAARVYKVLAPLHGHPASNGGATSSGASAANKPAVFVKVDQVLDASKKLPPGGKEQLGKIVTTTVERTGYSTSWPGGTLPTSTELGKSHAFIVASTVKAIDVTKSGRSASIACTVQIRVAPWGGSDSGERWEANKAASASGTAKATTGSADKEIQSGVRDCIEAVGEDVTQRQVVPFLKKLASNP